MMPEELLKNLALSPMMQVVAGLVLGLALLLTHRQAQKDREHGPRYTDPQEAGFYTYVVPQAVGHLVRLVELQGGTLESLKRIERQHEGILDELEAHGEAIRDQGRVLDLVNLKVEDIRMIKQGEKR